jgi:hypothetical protein
MMMFIFMLPLLAQVVASDQRSLNDLLSEIERSGRVLTLTRTLDERLGVAPGAPPLLAFRYLEGQERGHYKGLDLVLDDAGH